jgi:hypothetical protein
MLRGRLFTGALLVLAGGAFLYGIAHLFALRFEAGDTFPPYSTLRGDPLGTKVLFESLRALPGISVERNEKPLSKFSADGDTTLFYIGAKLNYWREDEIVAFENLVSKGGRVVLAFQARDKAPERVPEKNPAKSGSPSPTPTPEERDRILSEDELAKRWKFQIGYNSEATDDQARNQAGLGLEPSVNWYSAMYFSSVAEPWHVVYAIDGRAVIIEGSFGSGTAVLASDAYFMSNEAMPADRKPALLAWLVGKSHRLVFDETHHQIYENPGVANLVRKYRLHGLIVGLLVLIALFAWKSAASFLPRDRTSEDAGAVIAGRDAYSGFTNLLRRGLPPRELLAVCLGEWRRSSPRVAPGLDEKLRQFGGGAGPDKKLSAAELLRRYQDISRTIDASKWKRTPTT